MSGHEQQRGQTLVEFSLGIVIFLMLLIGTIDLGRGVFTYNGVSQAAREIARATSIHPGSGGLGASAETQDVVAVQRSLVPGLSVSSYTCVDIAGSTIATTCNPGHWVRVTVTSTFRPALPLLALFGPMTFTSASSAEIQ